MGTLHNIKTLKVKMALTSRLASHTCLLIPHGGMKLVLPSSTMSSIKSISPQEHQISREEFWEKNKRLSRPLSPHLTIYKPQMTSMLSITHRGTGVAWSLVLSGVGIGAIFSPVTFPTGLAALQSLQIGAPLIFIVKYGLSWMVCYHTINGLRHLVSISTYVNSTGIFCYFHYSVNFLQVKYILDVCRYCIV